MKNKFTEFLYYIRLAYLMVEIQTRYALSNEAQKFWEEESPLVKKILRNFDIMLENFEINQPERMKNQKEYFEKLVSKAKHLIEDHQKALVKLFFWFNYRERLKTK